MSFAEITPTDAHSEMDRYRIIDVREGHEFNGPLGHLEGAEHVPLSLIEDKSDQLAGARPLLLICRSGMRSGKACKTLQRVGLQNVTNLTGGMIEWTRAELPVVHTGFETLDDLVASIVAWLAQTTSTRHEVARGRVEAILVEAGASITAPSSAAIDLVLDALSAEFLQTGPPPDLEFTVNTYRRELAIL